MQISVISLASHLQVALWEASMTLLTLFLWINRVIYSSSAPIAWKVPIKDPGIFLIKANTELLKAPWKIPLMFDTAGKSAKGVPA